MADAVATQVLHESASDLVVKLTNISDGTGESGVTKVDVSALTPACTDLRLEEIIYSTVGMAVELLWDASSAVFAWGLPQDRSGRVNFRHMGMAGFLPNNGGAGKTGDLKLSTIGATSGDTYSIILVLAKIGA
jgi:hypothetical protein